MPKAVVTKVIEKYMYVYFKDIMQLSFSCIYLQRSIKLKYTKLWKKKFLELSSMHTLFANNFL